MPTSYSVLRDQSKVLKALTAEELIEKVNEFTSTTKLNDLQYVEDGKYFYAFMKWQVEEYFNE
jgi:hypothetical protein